MMVEVTLEGLAKKVDEATIQSWFFEEGDHVNEGDELVELTTGDDTVMIQATSSGILAEVYYDEGESVPRGEVLCLIDDEKVSDDDEDDSDEDEDEDDEDEEEEDEDDEDGPALDDDDDDDFEEDEDDE